MYRLTPRRLKKAMPLLGRHRAEIHKTQRMDARGFEMELWECRDVSALPADKANKKQVV